MQVELLSVPRVDQVDARALNVIGVAGGECGLVRGADGGDLGIGGRDGAASVLALGDNSAVSTRSASDASSHRPPEDVVRLAVDCCR